MSVWRSAGWRRRRNRHRHRLDGRPRAIFFQRGMAIGAGASEADIGPFAARREGDLTFVRIGEERYEIPDAVPFGG